MSCIEAEHSHSNDRTNEVTGGPIFCILLVVHETRVMRMTLDTREDTNVSPKYAGFVLTTLVSYLLKQRRYRGCYRWKEKQQDFERSGHTPLSHGVVLVLELYWEVTFIVTV